MIYNYCNQKEVYNMPEYEKNYEFKLIKDYLVNDCHVHIDNWDDGKENGYNFMEQLERYRTDFKMSHINIVCVPFYSGYDISQNILCAILKLEYPEYYVHGGLFYPNKPVTLPFPEGFTLEEQVDDMKSLGFDGIKMIETKPNCQKMLGVKLSDPMYDSYFAKLEEEQINILCHAADPKGFWDPNKFDPKHPEWNYSQGGYLSYEETHEDIYKVLENHPDLKITLAHMCFLESYPEKVVELLEKHPNLYFDICPHLMMFGKMSKDRKIWTEIFNKYSNRFVHGSDYSSSYGNISTIGHDNLYRFLLTDDEFKFWNGMDAHGLKLDKSIVEKILATNMYRIMGEKSKPVNKDALKEYIRKYESYLTDKNKDKIFEYCEEQNIL